MSSYDELLKQVRSLKLENTQLHRELQGNSSHLTKLENEASNLKDVLDHVQMSSGMQDDVDYSFAEESMCREHMAEGLAPNFEDSSDPSDLGLEVDEYSTPVANSNKGHPQSQSQGETTGSGGRKLRENVKEIVMAMQQLEKERINLVQEMEAEDKNRKWYYDQIEMITRKIRSLPVNDTYANQNPGLTRSHLDFEVKRLRETMHQSFGTNEEIAQRRDGKLQRLHHIDAELISLQLHREQLSEERDKPRDSPRKQRSQSPPANNEASINRSCENDLDNEQVTTATQTADLQQDAESTGQGQNISAIYHGAWPFNKALDLTSSREGSLSSGGIHQDMASVMSFNSTNTSSTHSTHGSISGAPPSHQVQGQPLQQQQLGSKVEMVYSLLSMLGTHDKDDMSRTLWAMSSSQDSCIAMRQSGCMPLLIQLLHGSDKDSGLLGNTRGSKSARARAAAALHNIVHSHPDDKRGRREARVLRLLEQIRAHCDQLREMSAEDGEEETENRGVLQGVDAMNHHPGPAIATLMKLSFDEEHRHAICTLGGLHAIAELLQVDQDVHGNTINQYNITMRRYACMALTNLTFGDGTNKALLCSMKTSMVALVTQLTNQNEDLCQVAASVLRNLSWKADLASKKTLREVGAVTTLVQSAMMVKKETTLKSILSALWNLSAHCSENKADICAVVGALEFLVSTLTYKSPSKTTSIIENGGGILRNVSSHIAVREEYRKILRMHGCMQILLKHLRSPSLTIVSNACGTLWNISARCAEDQQALWEMGAVTMLRNLVNSKHKMISMGSSAALKNLLAARPAVRGTDLNQLTNANRPTLHVRKQRALEADIDQSLSETCENVESPRDSPIETNKIDKDPAHFVYPVYPIGGDLEPRRPLVRGQYFPRSQSGDNSFSLESQGKSQQRVARSGSQDSVGSTHSDISHDRSRLHGLPANSAARVATSMGGSLERHKDSVGRFTAEGGCERNPLGPPSSRILQVMQEVALHAGIDSQTGSDQTGSKLPLFKQPSPKQQQQQKAVPAHALTPQQAFMYHRILQMRQQRGRNIELNNSIAASQSDSRHDEDEKPLDYSLKYRENETVQTEVESKQHLPPRTSQAPPTLVGNYIGKPYVMYPNFRADTNNEPNNMFYEGPHQHFPTNSSYAETDLDDPDQPTDYSARYGADFTDQYANPRVNYSARYEEPDPNCADCKYEEARRTNDLLEQTMPGFNDDQITMFFTEGTPYLSTATSLTDISAAVKILEEAEQHYPNEEQDGGNDETQNFSSKYGECDAQGQQKKLTTDTDKSSRSGSQTTDQQTATTVIPNYLLSKPQLQTQEYQSNYDDTQERSFHNTDDKNAPLDQTKTYCEEGTPVYFSRVSSLSSLHSSEAADRQDKSLPQGPLQSIEEADDMNTSIVKMPPPNVPPSRQQKPHEAEDNRGTDSAEKEHKTVTFDDKEQVQETPMMFSRSTSLGSLSSFDTQSVHSSVFSEYSRRASEVVSPSELPDSPSETMPPSPKRRKSPDRFQDKKVLPTRRELIPQNDVPQFTSKAAEGVRKISPAGGALPLGGSNLYTKDTDSDSLCKGEVPKVYAEEGTPPVFSDTLSQLSLFSTNDAQNMASVTQADNLKVYATENVPTNYMEEINRLSLLSLNDPVKTTANNDISSADKESKYEVGKAINVVGTGNLKAQKEDVKASDGNKTTVLESLNQLEDKDSSLSEVSEGEEDILASIISSAMPNSSKKMRKSSSDNAIKKRSANSSKTDSGASSRSKTPAKSANETPASKNSSSSKSAKRCLNMQGRALPSSSAISPSTDRNKINVNKDKTKASIPKPKPHKDVKRVIQQSMSLDDSIESTKSFADEDTPFNLSSTKTVVTPVIAPKPNIVRQAESFQSRAMDEDTVRQYATEDTPFSGSGPSSPKSDRKFNIPEDMNQDVIKSYATEDTPFSGSIPASPKMERRNVDHHDMNDDVMKSYATEDTPYSGSIPASPKQDRKKSSIPKPQVPNVKKTAEPRLPSQVPTKQNASDKARNINRKPPPPLIMNSDSIKSYATEDTPLNGSSLPSPKPEAKHTTHPVALLQNLESISGTYEGSSDVMKTYATEGTPLNFSRTGSFSDLSSINTNMDESNKPQMNSKPVPCTQVDDSLSDNSSNVEDNEDLLSELIQAAIPPSKPGKSRRSMDRRPEGAEGKDTFRFDIPPSKPKVKPASKFQPLKTSSVSYEQQNYSESSDNVRTYAVEGTPVNFSTATSLSDLTVESSRDRNKSSRDRSYVDSSTAGTYGTSNDSVFMQSELAGADSMNMYDVEGTPQTFSCNDSLSSLSIIDEDRGSVSEQIKNIANLMMSNKEQSATAENKPVKVNEQRSDSRSSNKSADSLGSARDMERHVVGQSSEESQSVSEKSHPLDENKSDEMKKFTMEGTPTCFSRNSSLSSIPDMNESHPVAETNQRPVIVRDVVGNESSAQMFKEERQSTSFRNSDFSRNSSHSSLIVPSDDDDDPDDLALLDACISSAIPQKSKPSRDEKHKSSRQTRSNAGRKMKSESDTHKQTHRNYSSGDEAEMLGSHDSRYSNWRNQPHKSCDEIFVKPSKDAKGRPCRRSRSQDSEKILKHQKEISNKELAQQYGRDSNHGNQGNYHLPYRGSFDSLPRNMVYRSDNRPANADIHLQQIISESQNITRSIENRVKELNESVEKSDEYEKEKEISPDDQNHFFMMCSGMTEISVESISKQSFPSSMAPDTDDDILDDSMLGSFRTAGEGKEMKGSSYWAGSGDTTITERNNRFIDMNSEDELALEHNASLVVTELFNKTMTVSGVSNVDDDRFIENETLSLVSNDLSDTVSEDSVTWSANSDRTNEFSEYIVNTDSGSPSQRRPKILKPGEKSDVSQNNENKKIIRGKRKPLYSSRSVSSASSKSQSSKSESFGKARPHSMEAEKKGLKSDQKVKGNKKGHALKTAPQASSTPVKDQATSKQQQNTSKQSTLQKVDSNNQRNTAKSSPPKHTGTATRIPSAKTSPRNKIADKPQMPVKQGTFVKESTTLNAPVIIPDYESNVLSKTVEVKRRQKKGSDSSPSSRPVSGCSRHSNRNSGGSDSASESWSKALNSYNFLVENGPEDLELQKKDSKGRRSVGSMQAAASKKALNNTGSPMSKIPSPYRGNLNKSGSGSNLRQGNGTHILKSNSGSSLGKMSNTSNIANCGIKRPGSKENVRKSESNTSLRSNNSRPGTPVDKKGSTGNIPKKCDSPLTVQQNTGNKSGKKPAGSKGAGTWKKDNKVDKSEKENKPTSKLPVANTKVKPNVREKKDTSSKTTINRNTVILSESALDGLNRSSTYDKLSATNHHSQIPSCDENHRDLDQTGDIQSKMNASHRPACEFEVGVEYNLDEAWSTNIEQSIEAMSRSIEEAKNKKDSFYTDDLDISKMDFSESPGKRLSKSGSMSEIELEFGRINSSTWRKKKSHNDFSVLPNADETSKTLPLVKRAESLNFPKNMSMSVSGWNQLDAENDNIWVKRDEFMRGGDMNTTKSKKKGFRGSSGFLPIKNVVKHVFGSKKGDKDKEKQSKSFSVSDKDVKKFDEMKKMSESMSVKSKKDSKPSKAELKQMKAELKASKAEAKAEAKALKKEAKLSKSGKKDKSKMENKLIASSECSNSSSSLKKSAEDLIDIDRESDEEFINMTSSSTSKSECSDSGNNVNKKSLPQNSDGVKSSVFPQQSNGILVQETKTSPQAKVPPFNYNPPRTANSSVETVSQNEQTIHNTRTDVDVARRKLSLKSEEMVETDSDKKRKCIITTV